MTSSLTEQVIKNTADFLAPQGIIDGVASSYAKYVNRTYFDAAVAHKADLVSLLPKSPVSIGVLLDMSGDWLVGQAIRGVLPLAVEKVNADPKLLPGRSLKYELCHSGHNYIDHNYLCHNYMGHNCTGHNYIGTCYETRAARPKCRWRG